MSTPDLSEHSGRRTRAPSLSLTRLARLAQETRPWDAVIVRSEAGIFGSGVAVDRDKSVCAGLICIERLVAEGVVGDRDAWADDPWSVGARLLAREGFGAFVWHACRMGSREYGALHFFKRRGTPLGDPRIEEGFARHCAVSTARMIAGREGAGAADGDPLSELDTLLMSEQDLATFTIGLEKVLRPIFGSVRTGLMMVDHELGVLQTLPGFFRTQPNEAASYQVDLSVCESNSARVFLSNVSYLSNDPENDPALMRDWVAFFRPRRIASVPLWVGDEPLGLLHVAGKGSDFTLGDLDVLETFAPRIARALALIQELLRARRQQRLERILTDLAVPVMSARPIQPALASALEEARTVVEAEIVAMTFTDGMVIGRRPARAPSPYVEQALRRAAQQPPITAEVTRSQGAGDSGAASLHIPILLGSQRIGTLSAVRLRGEHFDAAERDALQRLAGLVTLALAADGYRRKRDEIVRLRERHRIADDLHDHVAQLMFVAQVRLDALLECEDIQGENRMSLTAVSSILAQGDSAIREVITHLSERQEGSLADRIMGVVEAIEREFGLPVTVHLDEAADVVADTLPASLADAIIRVARESLTNVGKHAGPCHAVLELRRTEGELVIEIVDNGIGLTRSEGACRYGLQSLRHLVDEYDGSLTIERAQTGGVRVRARFAIQ